MNEPIIKTIEKSYAKLNLALDVLNRRDDGYHDLHMVMQSISLHDVVTVQKTTGADISISCNLPYIPTCEKNIAHKTAKVFMNELEKSFGVNIDIQKNIPAGSGLAGGSANAASVLIGLNKLHNFPFDDEKLIEIGKAAGADVPFCIAAQLSNGTYCAVAKGIGEKLTKITPLDGVVFVLVKPKISISTKWAFGQLDTDRISRRPNIDQVIEGIKDGDIAKIAQNTANVLEGVVSERYPSIEKLKNDMKNFGARFSLMSGSGSTIFGGFDDKRKAYRAFEHFEKLRHFTWMSGKIET